MSPRRILITGVANWWGARLAARLARTDGVERVVGIDIRRPAREVPGLEWVEADIRSPEVAEAVVATGADTVVHNDVPQFAEPGMSGRVLHEVNVIGTLQLLAACARLPDLRTLVVRGSAAIYGAEPGAPQFFTEEMARTYPLRTRWQRDVGELESLFGTFARRHPDVRCTMLRLQPVIGPTIDTPVTRLLRVRAVPVYLGFDPRVQLLDEDDSVEAILAAIAARVDGPVNVAGAGTVSLTRMLRVLGRIPMPVPSPAWGPVTGAFRRVTGTQVTSDIERYVRYGRGVDLRRLTDEVGFAPRYTTLGCIERFAAAGPVAEAVAA